MTARPTPDALVPECDPYAPLPGRLQRLRHELPPRDLLVLRDVAALQLMGAQQIQRLRFAEGSELTRARRTRRALERLHARRLVTRLARRIGGVRAGSAGYIYRAAPDGRHLLGLVGPRGGRHRQQVEPAPAKAAHVLAITELAVTLHEAHRAGRLDLVRFETEPTCWRTWTGPAGDTRHLRPDAFVIVAAGEWEHLWFAEVDMGTERPHRLRAKADVYRAYAASGTEQARWGTFPLVAYLASAHDARGTLARALEADPLAAVGVLADAPAVLSPVDPQEQPA